MAPKRGGGSGSSGSSGSGSSGSSGSSGIGSSCPNAFQDVSVYTNPIPIVDFVRYCVVFALALVVLMIQYCIKKRHGGVKRLAGPIYLSSLLFTLTAYALLIIGTMLQECETTDYNSFYDWSIGYIVLSWIGSYLLLVIVVWSVNSLLCERLNLNEKGRKVIKIMASTILGFVGAITCSYIGLSSYNSWTYTTDGIVSGAKSKKIEDARLYVACLASYLFGVIAASALSIGIMVPRHFYRLLGRTIALNICMFISFLFPIVRMSLVFQRVRNVDKTYEVLHYIPEIFSILSYIAVLILAKSEAWEREDTGLQSTP